MVNDQMVNKVRLFLTDVDGCLTEGGMYYTAEGEVMKRFCVYDGMGMVRLQQAGVACGILTSELSDIVLARARKLHLQYLYLGAGSKIGNPVRRYIPADAEAEQLPSMTKLEATQEICSALGISLGAVCYVGDDINDIDLLKEVGMPCCPPNARPEVLAIKGIHVLKTPGGQGAIREITDEILGMNE